MVKQNNTKRDGSGRMRNYTKEYNASRTPKRRADNVKRQKDEYNYVKVNGKVPTGKELDHKKMLGGSTRKRTPKTGVKVVSKGQNRRRQPKRGKA